MKPHTLLETVEATIEALDGRGVAQPQVLFLMGTGTGTVHAELGSHQAHALSGIAALPPAWQERVLHTGTLGGVRAWMIDDGPEELSGATPEVGSQHEWTRALFCWLAAARGATVCVHTSAGITLEPDDEDLAVGALALISDHINLSGRNPLRGLGETRLGPLFPDQTQLHHRGLRALARECARARGIRVGEAVVACASGPSLSTPAELGWYRTAGAQVVVQDIAAPLIASAHAGLAMLAVIALTDDGSESMRLQQILEQTEACAPALEDLIVALAPDVARVANELAEELA